jgi:hypothetical protein
VVFTRAISPYYHLAGESAVLSRRSRGCFAFYWTGDPAFPWGLHRLSLH